MTKARNQLLMGLIALAAITAGQDAAAGSGKYDCVIEPDMVTELGSPVSGIIDEVLVDRGDMVKAGAVVARLRSEIEEATLEIARARALTTLPVDLARNKADLTKKDLDRTSELFRRSYAAGAVMDKAVAENDQAVLNVKTAEQDLRLAQLEMNRAQVSLDVRTIRSPIDGLVVERLLKPGEHAHETGTKIVRIARIDPLHVEVYLPIAMYPKVDYGMNGEVRPAEPIGGVHKATIIVVDKVFDSASNTFGVRLSLPNPGGVMPAGINCKIGFPDIDD